MAMGIRILNAIFTIYTGLRTLLANRRGSGLAQALVICPTNSAALIMFSSSIPTRLISRL